MSKKYYLIDPESQNQVELQIMDDKPRMSVMFADGRKCAFSTFMIQKISFDQTNVAIDLGEGILNLRRDGKVSDDDLKDLIKTIKENKKNNAIKNSLNLSSLMPRQATPAEKPVEKPVEQPKTIKEEIAENTTEERPRKMDPQPRAYEKTQVVDPFGRNLTKQPLPTVESEEEADDEWQESAADRIDKRVEELQSHMEDFSNTPYRDATDEYLEAKRKQKSFFERLKDNDTFELESEEDELDEEVEEPKREIPVRPINKELKQLCDDVLEGNTTGKVEEVDEMPKYQTSKLEEVPIEDPMKEPCRKEKPKGDRVVMIGIVVLTVLIFILAGTLVFLFNPSLLEGLLPR